MKVAFCSSPLVNGHKARGIGAYTEGLLSALKEQPDIEIQEFSNLLEVQSADIVHYPFFDLFTHTLPFIKKIPTVVTIHDVIPLTFPEAYPPGIKGSLNNLLQKISLGSVAAVITDSEASKQEIQKYLDVDSGKVYVVPLAPATHFRIISDKRILSGVEEKFSLPDKFALYTGSVNYNKNLLNLTEGVLNAGLDIVLVGKSFETRSHLGHPELRSFAEFLKKYAENPKVHILGFVEDEDLVAITNQTTVFLLPSFKEGFGLPILEAQACGAPVITSNVSSMPEVAGKGAILVDPSSAESISEAINKIICDKELRVKLIEEGFENKKKFSWEKVVKETVEVYHSVIENNVK